MKNKFLTLAILVVCAIIGRAQVANAQAAPEVLGDAAPPNTYINTIYTPNTGGTIYRPTDGAGFQAALDAAQLGDTIELQAATAPDKIYTGNFHLPKKPGTGWIIIRPVNLGGISAPEVRINPTIHAAAMPRIQTASDSPAIRTDPGAHHYRLIGLEITLDRSGLSPCNASGLPCITSALVELGFGNETDLPHNIIVDRCYVHGIDATEMKRGVQLNGKTSSVIDSYVSNIQAKHIETQAVSGWNGPGPFKVVNNYLEASSETLFFGGGEIALNRVPSDIEIRRNHLYKQLSWRHNKLVKNLFELKNARRVMFDTNLLENNWAWEWDPNMKDPCVNNVCDAGGKGQVGIAVLFTPRNESSNNATWTVVEDVTFQNNIVRHSAGGIRISAYDDLNVSQQTKRITIRNNLFEDINASTWGPSSGNSEAGGPFRGELFFIVGKNGGALDSGPKDLHITHNTGFVNGNFANFIWGMDACSGTQKAQGFIFTQNIVQHNSNNKDSQAGGVAGGCNDTGNDTLSAFYDSGIFKENVLVGGDASLYSLFNNPPNQFPADWATVKFEDMAAGDYRLKSDSPYKLAGSDNKDLGLSNAALLPAATPAPVAPLPLRINAGGPQYVDGSGKVWLADGYYLAGFPASTTANIANTTEDALYRTDRFGGNASVNPLGYAIRVPNGSYTVRLHFAETYWGVGGRPGPGQRVFNVKIEATQVFSMPLDIFAEAGALTALIKEAQTTVTDGILNIDFITLVDNAKINAIEVIPENIPNPDFWENVVGATANGNDLMKLTTGTSAWNAGATSVQSLSGVGYVEFTTAENNANKMAGLNSNHAGQSYSEIDYAIGLGPTGNVRIYENNTAVFDPVSHGYVFSTYQAGDVFRVAIEGTAPNLVVKYYQNGTLLHTSGQALPSAPLVLDTSLYTPGATINDAKVVVGSTNPDFWENIVGATANGNDLMKLTTGTSAWNAGATSVQSLSGVGYVEFTTDENNANKMAGLNSNHAGQSYSEIDYAIGLGPTGNVRIYENNTAVFDPVSHGYVFSTYQAGDVFRVAIEGTAPNLVVKYYQNSTLLHTSGQALPSAPLVLDTSLYTPGATINNAVMVGGN